jgi:hypothetical protein
MQKQQMSIGIIVIGMLVGWPVLAQPQPAEQIARPGMVLEAFSPTNTLCIINTAADGPHWFLLNTTGNTQLGVLKAGLPTITALRASPDAKYLAVLSQDGTRTLVELIDLPKLLQTKTYQVVQKIDPAPGKIDLRGWDGLQVQVGCDMLLTRRDPANGRVSQDWALVSPEVFAMHAVTGQITGVSEGARNPAQHYANVLLNQSANEADKNRALEKVLKLDAGQLSLVNLVGMLEHETDPQRILKLLDELDKLRKASE